MRALLITLEGVKEVQIGVEVEKTYALLENRPAPKQREVSLESMYRLMDCHTVTGAGYPDQAHACWADDNGLLTAEDGTQVTVCSWFPGQLVGKLLVTGFDPKTGGTTEATLSVAELESMVKIGRMVSGELTIYSKPNCPWCVRAKELATEKGMPFTEVDISQDQAAKDWLVSQGHKTVPQIYLGGSCIGGYEHFAQFVANQECNND